MRWSFTFKQSTFSFILYHPFNFLHIPTPPFTLLLLHTHTHTHTHLNEKKRFSIISQIEHNMGMSHKNDDGLGAVWIHFFGYSISITHHSSFITHHSSLNFSHPFGIITQFPSLNIFHTICGPIPVNQCSFFFFFFFLFFFFWFCF